MGSPACTMQAATWDGTARHDTTCHSQICLAGACPRNWTARCGPATDRQAGCGAFFMIAHSGGSVKPKMSRKITSRDQLRELRLNSANRWQRRQAPQESSRQCSSRGAWFISPPADGCSYRAAEVAGLLDVRLATVRDWISRGVGGVRLRTLRVPRGRVAPADLCAFLSAVNGREVRLTAKGAE